MNSLFLPEEVHEIARKGFLNELKKAKISPHFTWGEVFTNCSELETQNCPLTFLKNAQKQAATMESVREVFDAPIVVHSWYRDKAHNARIGGAEKSLHLRGLATDFHVVGYEGAIKNRAVQVKLDSLPFLQDKGLEWTNGEWTHVDTRGYKARFGRV
jgi:hypothetical protein